MTMALADIQTLQFNIPTVQVLRLAVQSGRARRVEALRVAEAAWDKYNAAVDAGDPSARYLGDLAMG